MQKLALTATALTLLSGCATDQNIHNHYDAAAEMPHVSKAACSITPTEGNNVRGMIVFTLEGDQVRVQGDVFGLTPGEHGFHVHQWGDISAADGTATGGHFNPDGHDHSGPHSMERHAGDLGNMSADETGYARVDFRDSVLKLNGNTTIVGRSVIIHAGADDLQSQPTGNAGARVAQGVIGISH